MVSSTLVSLSSLILAAVTSASPVSSSSNSSSVFKPRGDAPCADNFDFYISAVGPNGAIPSVGFTVQMSTDGDDYVLERSTCYLGKWGGGCKWQKPGVATVKVNADHYDFTHDGYGFSTGPDLTGKEISWTVEGCPDYSCKLKSSQTTVIDPASGLGYPMTITACDGKRADAFTSDGDAGSYALAIARPCTADDDPDCNNVITNTNIGDNTP